MDAKEIDVAAAIQLFESKGATFVDVRDPETFRSAHIPGAVHLHDGNVAEFTSSVGKDQTVVVYCYHGNSSKGGAAHFAEQGIAAVSMMGGFAAWSAAGGASEAAAPGAAPSITVAPEAVEQLTGFLAGETAETRVRLTLDGARFGLALDEARPGELEFEQAGLRFVIAANLAGPVEGVRIGWAPEAGGFTIDGGSPPVPKAMDRGAMRAEIESLVAENKIVAFLKGTADSPMCGFSAKASQILQSFGKPFADRNALAHPEYRYALTEFSDWPTLPQIFIGGKLVGGSDILGQLHESGELAQLVEEAFAQKA